MTREDLQKLKELKQKWLAKSNDYSSVMDLVSHSAEIAKGVTLSEEDEKELFKLYGCMNSWTPEKYAEFQVVNTLHEAARARDPGHHKMYREQRGRGYVILECSCGFKYEWDESD